MVFSVIFPKLPFSKVYDACAILKETVQGNLIFESFFSYDYLEKVKTFHGYERAWHELSANC